MAPERAIRKITWWGFFVNIGLAVFKVIAGIVGNSQAVIADGVHSVTDTVTDIAVIAGSYFWAKPADAQHPYGHKRIETTVSIFIGLFLLAAAVMIAWQSISDIRHLEITRPPGFIALVAAVVSILAKEGIFRWTRRVGRTVNSISLAANAWHHRLDALSSVPVLVAVAVAIIHPAWSMADPLAALFVATLVFVAASRIVMNGFRELVDEGAPRETCETIQEIAQSHEKVRHAYNIRTRYAGNRLQVDLHVAVNGNISVQEGHRVAEAVKEKIIEKGPPPGVLDVIVHIEPVESLRQEDICL